MFIVASIVCGCSSLFCFLIYFRVRPLFCFAVLCVLSSFAIISERVALLMLCSEWHVAVIVLGAMGSL